MKKLTLLLTVAMMAIATTASAQFTNGKAGAADTENYNRAWVSYSPVEIENMDLTGISAGWTKGLSIMSDAPLFLETGVNIMYGFGSQDEIDSSYLGVNIPALITYKFAVSEKAVIAPYAGVNIRGNILGKSESDGYYSEEIKWFDDAEDGGLDAKRVCFGASVGVNFELNKFSIGVGYTTDFTKFAVDAKVKYFSIAVGMKF